MKIWIGALLLVAGSAYADDATELEPAVRTSTAAADPGTAKAAETKPAAAARSTQSAPDMPHAGRATLPGGTAAPKAGSRAHDQIDLDATQITGNRELPNVMYVVPWKKPDLGDFAGRPPKSLLDELLAPVDRDVFRRQNRYFAALHPDAAAAPAAPASPPASGAAATLPARDEK